MEDAGAGVGEGDGPEVAYTVAGDLAFEAESHMSQRVAGERAFDEGGCHSGAGPSGEVPVWSMSRAAVLSDQPRYPSTSACAAGNSARCGNRPSRRELFACIGSLHRVQARTRRGGPDTPPPGPGRSSDRRGSHPASRVRPSARSVASARSPWLLARRHPSMVQAHTRRRCTTRPRTGPKARPHHHVGPGP